MHRVKILSILAVFFSSVLTYAQSDSSKSNSQFQFHLVNGFSLSYLRVTEASSGLRFKIDVGLLGTLGDGEYIQHYSTQNSNGVPAEVQNSNNDESSNSQSLKINVNYLWFSNIAEGIRVYFGAGPAVNYNRLTSEINRDIHGTAFYPASKSLNKQTSSSFELGLMGAIGIECSISEKLSLLAEYNLEGTYIWGKSESRSENQLPSKSITESTENNNSWNYRLSNLKIGIAYKF